MGPVSAKLLLCALVCLLLWSQAQTQSVLDFVSLDKSILPFDLAVLVAPPDGDVANVADFEIIARAGEPLPFQTTIQFYPSVQGQTVHKTALYVAPLDKDNGFVRCWCCFQNGRLKTTL